ncbi:uncharacterized protein LOC124366957 isoform X2 [Homalodisca vitripennis]|uniref:uncharacterized protein LOC124366957 isoform X2 n=1 Tax=Homalodisca vitripennis TaxID=197043 RepID=UPI001EECCB3C|nr:uncharacterized protein LOC124366957 isoform X2 [Homalodisca vitripennis]
MGKSCEQLLPPSEALPGIGEHCVVFHNGKGFYYTCREYSTSFEKRQFKCVRAECGVTATMGPGLGSPLQDDGSHTHPADWGYRDKCLLLQTIKERFLRDNSSASLILQEILSSLIFESEEDNEASCNFESITIEEQTPLNLFKVEPCLLDPIDENNELEEEMDKLSTTLPPTARTYGRTRSKEKRLIKLSPTHEENEEEEEEVQRPDFVAVPGADELCSRLGTPEDALADMDYEIEETKLNRKRKQMTCEREESPSKQIHCTKPNKRNKAKVQLWNRADMIKAIQAVKENAMSFRRAAKVFSVPRTTLCRLARLGLPPEDAVRNKMGRKPVIPDELEKELVHHLLEMQSKLNGLKREDICRLAFQLCEKNGIKHPFRSDGVAGPTWFDYFINRHKNIICVLKT